MVKFNDNDDILEVSSDEAIEKDQMASSGIQNGDGTPTDATTAAGAEEKKKKKNRRKKRTRKQKQLLL